jgi:hypothetical protein
VTDGPTESLNNLLKRIKRIGFGFRNFENYRIRALLIAGSPNWRVLGSIVVRWGAGPRRQKSGEPTMHEKPTGVSMVAGGSRPSFTFGLLPQAATCHPAQRPDELSDIGDPILEQVPDAGSTDAGRRAQQVDRVARLNMLRKHENAGLGMVAAAMASCAPVSAPSARPGPRRLEPASRAAGNSRPTAERL